MSLVYSVLASASPPQNASADLAILLDYATARSSYGDLLESLNVLPIDKERQDGVIEMWDAWNRTSDPPLSSLTPLLEQFDCDVSSTEVAQTLFGPGNFKYELEVRYTGGRTIDHYFFPVRVGSCGLIFVFGSRTTGTSFVGSIIVFDSQRQEVTPVLEYPITHSD